MVNIKTQLVRNQREIEMLKHVRENEKLRNRGILNRERFNTELFKPVTKVTEQAVEKQIEAQKKESVAQQKAIEETKRAIEANTAVQEQQLAQKQKVMFIKPDTAIQAGPSRSVIQPANYIFDALNNRDRPESGLELKPIANTTRYKLGNHEFTFHREKMENRTTGETIDPVSQGLMILLTKKNMAEIEYTDEDEDSYLDLVVKSGAYLKDPQNPFSGPLSSKGFKWMNIVKPWYENRGNKSGRGFTVDIPEKNEELMDKLHIFIREREAGNCNTTDYIKIHAKMAYKRKLIQAKDYIAILEMLLT